MWQNMSQEDQKEADFERWQREHPAGGNDPAQVEDPSDDPQSSYKETAQAETIQEKDWSSLAMETFDNPREAEKTKLRACFDGKIVRKDLTKKIKEGANVPVYVLEFLLGQYCSSDDEEIIAKGVENVKRILADNFVRPDEAQKILSVLRARGAYTVIDKITVGLNIKKDVIRESLMTFQGVAHRLQYVATVRGVKWINDSKATNVNSCWYALESMTTPTVLILGGKDKGNDYSEIDDLVREKCHTLVFMGLHNEKLREHFGNFGLNIIDTDNLADAIQGAYQAAKEGDTVLLSPCCASFDLFKSYEDRGEQFMKAVKAL